MTHADLALVWHGIVYLVALVGGLIVASGVFIVVTSFIKGDFHDRRLNQSDSRLRQQIYDRRIKH